MDATENIDLGNGAILRPARPGDESGILECIRMLAEYEHEPDSVKTTEQLLRDSLFGAHPSVFAHVVEKNGTIVGIAVWFLNYSTWTGTNGIYLEDLFVHEAERANGYGYALLKRLASIAVSRGYERFEWAVLEWNEPSIRFYRGLGAVGMEEWRIQRVTGPALKALAE